MQNLWMGFEGLTPKPAKNIVEVLSADATNEVITVQYLGGSIVELTEYSGAFADYIVGKRAFVQGDRLKGVVDDLTYFEMSV